MGPVRLPDWISGPIPPRFNQPLGCVTACAGAVPALANGWGVGNIGLDVLGMVCVACRCGDQDRRLHVRGRSIVSRSRKRLLQTQEKWKSKTLFELLGRARKGWGALRICHNYSEYTPVSRGVPSLSDIIIRIYEVNPGWSQDTSSLNRTAPEQPRIPNPALAYRVLDAIRPLLARARPPSFTGATGDAVSRGFAGVHVIWLLTDSSSGDACWLPRALWTLVGLTRRAKWAIFVWNVVIPSTDTKDQRAWLRRAYSLRGMDDVPPVCSTKYNPPIRIGGSKPLQTGRRLPSEPSNSLVKVNIKPPRHAHASLVSIPAILG